MACRTQIAIFTVSILLFFSYSIDGQEVTSAAPPVEAPQPTLASGVETTVEINGDEPVLEGKGRIKVFRYGSISDGPVQVEIAAEGLEAFARISDRNGKLLKDLSFGGAQAKGSASVEVRAGEDIRITICGRTPEDTGILKITVFEVNREEGKKKINDAMREAQSLLAESSKAQKAGDHEKARALIRKALETMGNVPACRQSRKAMKFLEVNIGPSAFFLRDYETAATSWREVKQFYEDTLHPDAYDLQSVKMNISVVLLEAGRYTEARPILEECLSILERTVDPDDELLQLVRMNLAQPLKEAGEVEAARDLLLQVLGVYERNLPHDHPSILTIKSNLAHVIMWLGRHTESKEILEEVIGALEKSPNPDEELLQNARLNLASALRILGDLQGAHSNLEKVLEACKQRYLPDHIKMASSLYELAALKHKLGEVHAARTLFERVLEIERKSLDYDDPAVLKTRTALGNILCALGDPQGAREILEKVVKIYERIYPEDHQDLQHSRACLAGALSELRKFEEARKLLNKAIDNYELTHPLDHPLLQNARMKLAMAIHELGETREAVELLEKVLWICKQSESMDIRFVQAARRNLALVLWEQGDFERALPLLEEDLAFCRQRLPPDHLDLWVSTGNLAAAMMVNGEKDRAVQLIQDALKGGSRFLSRMIMAGSVREIGQSLRKYRCILNHYLSMCLNGMIPEPDSFTAAEIFRSAGARAGRAFRFMAGKGGEAIEQLQEKRLQAARIVASTKGDHLIEAIIARDRIDREIAAEVMKFPGTENILEPHDPKDIAAKLPEGWAGVSYLSYTHMKYPDPKKGGIDIDCVPSYMASIIHPDGKVESFGLGDAKSIEHSVVVWRDKLKQSLIPGSDRKAGQDLKELIWKPIARRLGGVKNVVLAPDSALATVPFEALPEKNGVLADEYTFAYQDAISSLAAAERKTIDESGVLVAFGNINYDESPEPYREDGVNEDIVEGMDKPSLTLHDVRPILRSGRTADVPLLEGTGIEARVVTALYSKVHHKKSILLEERSASKYALFTLAPRARYLHIATHGYQAHDDFKSMFELGPGERNQLYSPTEQRVRGLAPSLLSGLMLAGCNLPLEGQEDPGIISAEEIQALDLSRCDLAVLSACDTNVGMVQAGRGIMSMQRALGIAGVRGSITSLWKVNDLATCLLFMEFYRLLWEENLSPVESLRRAKLWLRNLTAEEIDSLIAGIPSDKDRSLLLKRSQSGRAGQRHPFASPCYWASFVYWGGLE